MHPNDAGMDYLASQYQAALTSAGKTPSGMAMYAYGDSWTANDVYNTAGRRAVVQLATSLGLALTNRAVGGDAMGDLAARAVGLSPFVAGTPGFAFVAAGVNDLTHADTAQQRTATANHLRATLAAICAAERIEQTANSGTTGTWTTPSVTTASGGSNLATTVNGSTVSFNITTAGTYYLLTHGANGTDMVGGILTVTQGGTTLATQDLNLQHVNTTNTSPYGYGSLAVRLANVQTGTLTITFSTAGRAGANGWVDALLRMSATPPTILAVKPVRVTNASYDKPDLLAAIRVQFDTMAAEFGSNVVVCDPAPGWTP